MTQLTMLQVAAYAYRAGFRDIPGQESLTVSIAVAEAESAGKTDATNITGNTPPSEDRGLWQINNYWHKEIPDSVAFTAIGNAHAAFVISNRGLNWAPWSTYKSGTYRKYLPAARTAANLITHYCILTRLLQNGSSGSDVVRLQSILRIQMDGQFGTITEAAVKAYQLAHRLTPDGIVGPVTVSYLPEFVWAP